MEQDIKPDAGPEERASEEDAVGLPMSMASSLSGSAGACGCAEKPDEFGMEPDPEHAAGGESRNEGRGELGGFTNPGELDAAIQTLTQIALEMDDPVQALEDGTDALAEALVAREQEVWQQEQLTQLQQREREATRAEFQQAYRHARLHRVGELIETGYSLDQAVALTNANEMEIRQRALGAGRDPDQVIYEYALRHGYRPRPAGRRGAADRARPAPSPATSLLPTALEQLAILSDEEFAEATRGDRWERLLKGR